MQVINGVDREHLFESAPFLVGVYLEAAFAGVLMAILAISLVFTG